LNRENQSRNKQVCSWIFRSMESKR